jgi:hypothetical protein
MKKLWAVFRCRFLRNHRWQQFRQDEETYFQCLDCKRRVFGDKPPEGDMTQMGGAGGGVGGF